jgi:hypothetical protein
MEKVMGEKVGRFEISFWRKEGTTVPRKRGYVPEREQHWDRCCIRYSRKWNGKWQNQCIWCNPDELRSLQQVMSRLDNVLPYEVAQ